MNNKRKMKRIARVMALVLTGAMVLGGAATVKPVTAYAAEGSSIIENTQTTGKLTIHKKAADGTTPLADATFEIYKVVELVPGATAGEYASYTPVKPFDAVLAENEITVDNLGNYSAAKIEATALELKNAAASVTGISRTTGATGEAVFENLALGYYLVVETNAPEGYVAGSPFLVAIPSTDNYKDNRPGTADADKAQGTKWVYDVEVSPKNAQVSIDKKLADADASNKDVQDGSVKVGDLVKYEVTTTIPNYPDNYFEGDTRVDFTIKDKMDKGLEAKGTNIVVKVGAVGAEAEIEAANNYTITTHTKAEIAADTNLSDLEIAFTKEYIKANRGKHVIVTYYAEVTKDAVTGTDGNKNGVSLVYNHQPGEITEADGPEVFVYSFNIKVMKFTTDGGQKTLDGAKFGLYSDAGCTTQLGEATSVNGVLGFEKIDEGTYYLKELESPNGYTLLTDPIKVKITAKKTNGVANNQGFELEVNDQKIDATTGDYTTHLEIAPGTAYVAVENHKGFTLPSTGGAGIALFLIVGAAGIVLVSVAFTRKSRKAN